MQKKRKEKKRKEKKRKERERERGQRKIETDRLTDKENNRRRPSN